LKFLNTFKELAMASIIEPLACVIILNGKDSDIFRRVSVSSAVLLDAEAFFLNQNLSKS
jgi:hypothetical protein